MTTTCPICCSDFSFPTSSIRCEECKEEACLSCYETWIFSQKDDPLCMNGLHPLPLEIMYHRFDSSPWQEHRGKCLFLQQSLFFAEDMKTVSALLDKKRLWQELRILLSKKKRVTRGKAKFLHRVEPELLASIQNLRYQLQQLPQTIKEESTALMPCPRVDPPCQGHIMSSSHTCALCLLHLCGDCLVPLSADDEDEDHHVCIPNIRKNALSILEETKPCPQCAVRIYKTEGCDQMWCTQCRCAFSWETLVRIRPESERLHNPHYLEWRAQRNSNNNNLPLPWEELVYALYRNDFELPPSEYHLSLDILRFLRVARRHEYVCQPTEEEGDDPSLRHAYLMGTYSRQDVERLLWKREKKSLKKKACHALWTQVCQGIQQKAWEHIDSMNNVFPSIAKELETSMETIQSIKETWGGTVRGEKDLDQIQSLLTA